MDENSETPYNNRVNVFRLDPMDHTYFQDSLRDFMATQGVNFVDRIWESHVAVTRYFSAVTAVRRCFHQMHVPRRLSFLIWTDEPRYNTSAKSIIRGRCILPDLHIMNCYTDDIYVSNYYHCGWGMFRRAERVRGRPGLLTNRKIVIMTGYTVDRESARLVMRGNDVDLSWLRCCIAAQGHAAGAIDIYGPGWPAGMSSGNSRMSADWVQQKIEILRGYRFNLCMENTIYPFYCTEKIWHSIVAGCLPIYYGAGTRIYDDFPKGSFIDYSEVGSAEALFNLVQSMSEEEYLHRMNICVDVYNRIYDSGDERKTWNTTLNNIIMRLRKISHKN